MLALAWPTADFVRRQNTTPICTVRFKVNASIHDKQLKHFRGGGGGYVFSLPLIFGLRRQKAAIKVT